MRWSARSFGPSGVPGLPNHRICASGLRQNSTKPCATSGCGAPFNTPTGSRAQGGAALRRDPDHPRRAGRAREFLGIGAAVEIDAHAGGRVALPDVLRDLRRAVGEIAGVGRHPLDQLQARPSNPPRAPPARSPGLSASARRISPWTSSSKARATEPLFVGSARASVPAYPGSPRSRQEAGGGSFEALENLRIITDSELRHAGAHPDVIGRDNSARR